MRVVISWKVAIGGKTKFLVVSFIQLILWPYSSLGFYIFPILPLIPHLPTLSHPFPTLIPPISHLFSLLSHVFLHFPTHFPPISCLFSPLSHVFLHYPTYFPPLSHVFLHYLTHLNRATFETMLQQWKHYCMDNNTTIMRRGMLSLQKPISHYMGTWVGQKSQQ